VTNKEYAESLRSIADFFEQHPEVSLPYDHAEFNYIRSEAKVSPVARALGTCTKVYDGAYPGSFELQRSFGSIRFRAIWKRETVCERIEVGKKTIPEQLMFIPEHEEPVYKWRCPKSGILKAAKAGVPR
jgi:hypothetical protein